jgi:hypothetical protein
MRGIIVVVNGILSTSALATPANHIIITNVSHGFPPVRLIAIVYFMKYSF